MPDEVPEILHEMDVRAVIDDQVGASFTPDPHDGYILLNPDTSLSNTYNHSQLEARLNDIADNLNAVMNVLASAGLLIVYE